MVFTEVPFKPCLKVSRAPPVRSPIQLGLLSTPGSSYDLGTMFWKHLDHSSFSSVTICALYTPEMIQEKGKENRVTVQ